jgi:hypothetical protein
MNWTTPADLRAQVERFWSNGRLLTDDSLFPLELKLRKPDSRALSDRFEGVRQWIRDLESEPALRIEWAEVDHRVLGRNRVPARATVASREDALALIGRSEDATRYRALAARTRERVPELESWALRKPLGLLENAEDWDRVLDVVAWFREHPKCGLYLRQLDIPGVDTKFIEARKQLLIELLTLVLGPEDCAAGPRYFERRFGLATKPLQVRFRILDPRLAIRGLTDLTIPVKDLAALALPAERVYITENEVNGLAFPDVSGSIVIFGLGYGVEILSAVDWLRRRELYYWGDIDTYGFHMLDLLRASFPHARSFLMDRETLMEHRALWVQEENPYKGGLPRLTPEERAVCESLRAVRLEQERIRFSWVERALRGIVVHP